VSRFGLHGLSSIQYAQSDVRTTATIGGTEATPLARSFSLLSPRRVFALLSVCGFSRWRHNRRGRDGGAKEQIFQPQITHKFFVFWSSKKAMDTTLTKFSGTVVEVKG